MPSEQTTPMIDLRVFPGVVTLTRLMRATDDLLVRSARTNAARAMSENRDRRVDFASQEDEIHESVWRVSRT